MASGIEWQFAVIDKATAPVKDLSKAIDALTAATAKSSGAIDKLNEKIEGLGKKSEKSKEHSESLFKALLESAAVEKGIELLKDTFEVFGDAIVEAEQKTQLFENAIAKYGDKANEVREITEQFARATGQGFEKTEASVRALADAGVRLELLPSVLASIGDRALGNKEKTEALTSAFAKLERGSGGVKSIIGLLGLNQEQLLASTGKTIEELNKLSKTGKAGADAVTTALIAQQKVNQGGHLGEAAEKSAAQIGNIIDKIKELPTQIAKAFESTDGAFGALKQKLVDVYNVLSDPKTIQKFADILSTIVGAALSIVGAFTWMSNVLRDNIKIFEAAAIGIGLLAIALLILEAPAIAAAASIAIVAAGIAVVAAAPYIIAAAIAFAAGLIIVYWDDIVDAFSAAWTAISNFASSIVGALTGAFNFVVNAGAEFLAWYLGLPIKFLKGALDIGSQIIAGIVEGITNGISAVKDAIKSVASAVVGKFSDHLEIHSPSRVFAEMGEMSAKGFGIGIKSGMEDINVGGVIPVEDMTRGQPAGGSRIGTGGGGSITIGDITIAVSVEGGANVSPEELAERIKEATPGAILSAIERLAQQQGVQS